MGPSEYSDLAARWQGLLHQLPYLLAPRLLLLSSKEIPAMPGPCRSRGLMLELESLGQLSPRKTGWCTGRRAVATTRGLDSTVTLGMMARLTLSSTPLVLMDSESSEVTIPSGGQTSAQNQNVNAATGEIKEYDYEYYDDTKPSSPFVNPHDPSHHQKDLLDGNLAGLLAGRTFTTAAPLPFGVETTPRPNRFFPPGQIKLDRFPEGFNFNFKSQ